MVWGCITAKGLGWICCIEGNIDAKIYCEILSDDLLGTLQDLKIDKKDIQWVKKLSQCLAILQRLK